MNLPARPSAPRRLWPLLALLFAALPAGAQPADTLRPPAVPLVTHDPYFSIWSAADKLTDGVTKHWTGADHTMGGFIRVDGTAYRFMGPHPREVPALEQTGLEVWPTRTIYHFAGAGVALDFTFTTPTFPDSLDLVSRPVTYLTWDVRATDGQTHDVSLYLDVTAQLAVDRAHQPVDWARFRLDNMSALRIGASDQAMLTRSGDDLRIEWGYAYLVTPDGPGTRDALGATDALRAAFVRGEMLPADALGGRQPLFSGPVRLPAMATTFALGRVGAEMASRYAMIGYDDLYSLEYFGRKLRPWWRRNGMGPAELFARAARDYPALTARARRYDEELVGSLEQAGGSAYARVATLAFRQTLAAHKLVADFDGRPLYFSKENFSNGSIGTVDLTYPSSPFFLLLSPPLLKAQLDPIFEYAASPRWPFPFAPHDVGQYPLANGQQYGGGETSEENQMPVEESGNMIIMAGALAHLEGNADYARQHWAVLTRWAEYLREKGLDPESQLSTDDFSGHLAHNANLSIKAIVALGCYARLAEMMGDSKTARDYRREAEAMARQWVAMAGDGDHYRLAFDKPGTWSQKYNLVWDQLLGLDLFPESVARTEIAYYKQKQNAYGLPLDNRAEFTKLDWIVWTATLADSRADFEGFVRPVLRFLNTTPDRVPMTDWYWTHNARHRGFQARSVVGGVFIKMLEDRARWHHWADRARPADAASSSRP